MNKILNRIGKFFKTTAGMVLIVTLLVGIAVQMITGTFFSAYNISTLTRAATFVILVGFGQTLVLLTGGIDLSVAAIGSVCGMANAIFMVKYGMNPYLAILLSTLIGIPLGAINGFFIAKLKLTPFIVTLATMEIYQGFVYVVTKGMPITGMSDCAGRLADGVIGGILPNIVVMMIVICIVLTIMLTKMRFGRYIYALGGNRSCAKIVGIPTERIEIIVYCLSGLLSAFAGVMMSCKLESFQATIGESWQMGSITAAVLGGTSMLGGFGSVVGTIMGGLLTGVISTCITLLRISSYWETIVTGVVVLIAIFIDAVKDNEAFREKFYRKFKTSGTIDIDK
jgi:ribose transport system permease protein